VIEVDMNGGLFVQGQQVGLLELERRLVARQHTEPRANAVTIRADLRAAHRPIRDVMDLCARRGVWNLEFIAIKEHRKPIIE
jgi:biopolymer transport protein ExbD